MMGKLDPKLILDRDFIMQCMGLGTNHFVIRDVDVFASERIEEYFSKLFPRSIYPIKKIEEYFEDIKARYKSSYYIKKDVFQLFFGIDALLIGCLTFIASAILSVFSLLSCLIHALVIFKNKKIFENSHEWHKDRSYAYKDLLSHLLPAFWLLNGFSNILYGLFNIITFPLTLLLNMPIRALRTKKQGMPKIEENEDIKRLVQEAIKIKIKLDEGTIGKTDQNKVVDDACEAIHILFLYYLEKGQKTNIPKEKEEAAYLNITSDNRYYITDLPGLNKPTPRVHLTSYLELFKPQKKLPKSTSKEVLTKAGFIQTDGGFELHPVVTQKKL
jgi:hypothetical protein